MKAPLLVRTIQLAAGLSFAAAGTLVHSNELQSTPEPWQSFENRIMVDEYHQSLQDNRRQLHSNLKSAAKNAFDSMGVSDRTVHYMGSAIGFAAQDTRIHLNDNKSLSLDLQDVAGSDRALFFGYRKSW